MCLKEQFTQTFLELHSKKVWHDLYLRKLRDLRLVLKLRYTHFQFQDELVQPLQTGVQANATSLEATAL